MNEILLESVIDTIKILPFLFVAFFIMEFIEHKFSNKGRKKIEKAGKLGPLFGSLLGAVPQCGFSVMATNLYMARILTIGTLISIYLSTSDEMLPILISEGADVKIIIKILLTKIVISIIFGFVIDFILKRKKSKKDFEIKDFCSEKHCDCDHGIIKSAVKHTLSVIFFVFIINLCLNISFFLLGEENISKLFLKDNLLSPFISSLVGLIPNCGASVAITELYLNGVISFASCLSGLLTSSGIALAVLFKVNRNIKENIKIIFLLYFIGVLSGIIIEIVTRFI